MSSVPGNARSMTADVVTGRDFAVRTTLDNRDQPPNTEVGERKKTHGRSKPLLHLRDCINAGRPAWAQP